MENVQYYEEDEVFSPTEMYEDARGKHYEKMEGIPEHWEIVEKVGCGYSVGCATKYLDRAGKKTASPVEDLKKAVNYTLNAIENSPIPNKGLSKDVLLEVIEFVNARPEGLERSCMAKLLVWDSVYVLESAIEDLKQLIALNEDVETRS